MFGATKIEYLLNSLSIFQQCDYHMLTIPRPHFLACPVLFPSVSFRNVSTNSLHENEVSRGQENRQCRSTGGTNFSHSEDNGASSVFGPAKLSCLRAIFIVPYIKVPLSSPSLALTIFVTFLSKTLTLLRYLSQINMFSYFASDFPFPTISF